MTKLADLRRRLRSSRQGLGKAARLPDEFEGRLLDERIAMT
jgi:hypothetical protein